ncbi:MAG: tetraacyldisaccharide 4'-kinase [Planctomycetaceae bacterium]|jgi:tetraacyldisaccharide 4'-kinase|nr:tetraacyldisaccharide 4'-kinase [Planctomycetaceae bacterium]
MFDVAAFEQILSGKRNDLTAKLSRWIFAGLEIPYSAVTYLRNGAYDKSLVKIHRLPVPVISVGNLTLGGTGKTPFIAWLIRKCLEMGLRPGVASRGYHADETGWNDETRELALYFPEVPQAISPKRFAASQKMLQMADENRKPLDLVLLDDGFQHRKLYRDIDIVLLDAMNPFGYGRIFPRGKLRESVNSLKRADVAVLSRSDLVPEEECRNIRDKVFSINPNIHWCEITHSPTGFVSKSGTIASLDFLSHKTVTAFCGIGNPEGFRKTLQKVFQNEINFLTFPDHFSFRQKEMDYIYGRFRKSGTDYILCTVKDLVKIQSIVPDDIPLMALMISIQFQKESGYFTHLFNNILKIRK